MAFIAGSRVGELLNAAEDARNGFLPVDGGILDQTPAFVESFRLIERERAHYKAKTT